ncbi:MAG TPA: hypothetical protein VGS97_02940 [Actinocrinis sp.]|uniref:hypothetical protein n=1 Tax=Actinocrinis sp. TaxID=1920516 RepID=UPI002DDD2762|nr:hypothetical protein [Actinocrinis sp.]HEV2343028.1 hypothetical protein [Actinocrinis sp.]
MKALVEPDVLVGAAAGLRTVPPDFAVYEADAQLATRHLSMDHAALAALAQAGLPHRTDPHGAPLFDFTDLTNVALRSGSGTTVPELARRFLLRFMSGEPRSWYEERTWQISVWPPKGSAADDWRLLPLDGDAPGITVHSSTRTSGAISAVVTIAGAEDAVTDPEVLALYEDVYDALVSGDVAYQSVPEALRHEHERAWAEGVADCVVISRVLAGRIVATGRRARARRGYLLGLLGSDHAWTEVHEDGRWKCLDPVFELLARATPGTERFRAACRGGRFNRLVPCDTERADPLITLAGRPAPAWALAGVSSRPAEHPVSTDNAVTAGSDQ